MVIINSKWHSRVMNEERINHADLSYQEKLAKGMTAPKM